MPQVTSNWARILQIFTKNETQDSNQFHTVGIWPKCKHVITEPRRSMEGKQYKQESYAIAYNGLPTVSSWPSSAVVAIFGSIIASSLLPAANQFLAYSLLLLLLLLNL